MQKQKTAPFVAIACGGTGGHLFPGLAVAEELLMLNCDIMLLVSPKEVDQQAVKSLAGIDVQTLPAVGLTGGNFVKFAGGFLNSYRAAKNLFLKRPPQAVLAMGGFTSAPPILAGRNLGAKTFLHESNTIPGKANRWLSHFVDGGFVYFHETSGRMNLQNIHTSGMPVRSSFLEEIHPSSARMALGLNPKQSVLLVMGGSQGASGINSLVVESLPLLAGKMPQLQFIHLTGANDVEKVQAAYAALKLKAVVRPFLSEMDLALGAASVAISRSGASSLAELAALRVPSILVPYPTAADDHQYYNAIAFVESGAARMLEQKKATATQLVSDISDLLDGAKTRPEMQQALSRWHTPDSAKQIAAKILSAISDPQLNQSSKQNPTGSPSRILSKQLPTKEMNV